MSSFGRQPKAKELGKPGDVNTWPNLNQQDPLSKAETIVGPPNKQAECERSTARCQRVEEEFSAILNRRNMKNCRNPDCCKNNPHTMECKVCKECGLGISGWNCTLCDNCEVKYKKCGHCMVSLKDRHKDRVN